MGALVRTPEDGIEGINVYLESMGFRETFDDVFGDWLVANYLDPLAVGGYFYDGIEVSVTPDRTLAAPGSLTVTTPQYAGQYIEVRLPEGDALAGLQRADGNAPPSNRRL